MDSVKKEYTSGNSHHGFTVVDSDFPLEGDAKKALAVLTEGNYESVRIDIRAENKTTARKHLENSETSIESISKAIFHLDCVLH